MEKLSHRNDSHRRYGRRWKAASKQCVAVIETIQPDHRQWVIESLETKLLHDRQSQPLPAHPGKPMVVGAPQGRGYSKIRYQNIQDVQNAAPALNKALLNCLLALQPLESDDQDKVIEDLTKHFQTS